jgi:probable phosphoglycerate mutase
MPHQLPQFAGGRRRDPRLGEAAHPQQVGQIRRVLQAAVEHFDVTHGEDRNDLLITHNFVVGWFVRHVLDAPVRRWIGLNQDNCAITIVQWHSDYPPTLVSFNHTGHLQ